jgi:hypothetical protein
VRSGTRSDGWNYRGCSDPERSDLELDSIGERAKHWRPASSPQLEIGGENSQIAPLVDIVLSRVECLDANNPVRRDPGDVPLAVDLS